MRVRPEPLLEDDEGPRLERRRRLARGIVRERARGLAEGDDPSSGAGVLGEGPLEARSQRQGAGPFQDVWRAEDIARSRAAAVERRATPLPRGREGHLGEHWARRRREPLGDHLKGSVALAGGMRKGAERRLRRARSLGVG